MSDNNLIHGHQRYTPLYSGREVDIFNLSRRDISIEDIAHALSQLPMYGGHVKYHYSVAQHSVARLSAFDYTVRGAQKVFGASVTEKDTAELCRGLANGALADICCPLAIDRRLATVEDRRRRGLLGNVGVNLPGGPEALVVPMTAVDVAKALHEFDKFSRVVYPDLTCKNNAATALPKIYKWSRARLPRLAPEAWYTYYAVLEQNAPPRRVSGTIHVQGYPKTFDASEGPSSAKNDHADNTDATAAGGNE